MRGNHFARARTKSIEIAAVLIASFLLVGRSFAQQDGIVALFDTYMKLFNAGDSQAIAENVFSAPARIIVDWRYKTLLTNADVQDAFDREFDALSKESWSKSVKNSLNFCLASSNLAFVEMYYSQYDSLGNPIPQEQRRFIFLVARTTGGLRMVAAYDVDEVVGFDCQ